MHGEQNVKLKEIYISFQLEIGTAGGVRDPQLGSVMLDSIKWIHFFLLYAFSVNVLGEKYKF
jgi:hypothetical protein